MKVSVTSPQSKQEERAREVFVATMYRWGDPEAHSYVIGVFSSKLQADYAIKDEHDYRGGKYEGGISEHVVDEMYDRDADAEKTAAEIRSLLKEERG